MRKVLLFLFSLIVFSKAYSADCGDGPYGILINGSTKVEASAFGDLDAQGRKQYKAACVALKAGDVIKLINLSCDATWMTDLDPYGEYQKFSGGKSAGQITCSTAGSYDFYIKLSMDSGDGVYVGPGENCADTPDDSGDQDDQDDSDDQDDPDDQDDSGDSDTPKDYASSVPSQCTDVMLQAFYWDSNADKKHGNTRWNTLLAQASEISAYFDLVWLPPSAKSSGGVGYLPSQYCNQNSAWGTRDELEALIAALHAGGSKVIADIVINHSNNKSSWCDYYEEDFGEYGKFYPDASWICNTDEINSNKKDAGSCYGKATGSADDGYGDEANYADARDWDHNSEEVRAMCRAYLKWMKAEMKYDGWRYDYCKGFHNSHVNDYNTAAKNYFSVMEYWDGNKNTLWSRIQDAGCNTLTFDFGTKYDAFNNSLAAGNYSGCKAPGLLGLGKSKYAVTFVDSHDTYQRDNNEFGGLDKSMTSALKAKLLQCNAFILSMPGVPCVFYPHWKEYKSEIAPMVLARKAAGVHSESAVSDEGDASGYRATVTGKNGTLILELGNRVSTTKSGYTKAVSGTGYAIWTKTTKAAEPKLVITPASTTFKTDTLRITMKVIGSTESAAIYYTDDFTDPRTSDTRRAAGDEVSFTINNSQTIRAYAKTPTTQSRVYTCEYIKKEPQTTPITVAFYKPASWSKVYLYSWNTVGTKVTTYTGAWPGTELTLTNETGYHYYQFGDTIKEVNFIFNAGKDKDQTSDLWTDEDVCYIWSDGEEKKLSDCSSTIASVENVTPGDDVPTLDLTLPMYNILGQPVSASYQGIILQNGYKFINF